MRLNLSDFGKLDNETRKRLLPTIEAKLALLDTRKQIALHQLVTLESPTDANVAKLQSLKDNELKRATEALKDANQTFMDWYVKSNLDTARQEIGDVLNEIVDDFYDRLDKVRESAGDKVRAMRLGLAKKLIGGIES